jgi:hypothetical protein
MQIRVRYVSDAVCIVESVRNMKSHYKNTSVGTTYLLNDKVTTRFRILSETLSGQAHSRLKSVGEYLVVEMSCKIC